MMTKSLIASYRLANQQIAGTTLKTPEELLSWMCGIQAQDYGQAKWAVGLRLPGSTDADIERAIAQKKIVRTWAMRGTLQFVAAKDYRWIHSLLAHRFLSTGGSRNKQLELDEKIFQKSNALIVRALEKEERLTRNEIGALLKSAGIPTDQNRLSHLLHFATMSQLICFAPRSGKEFTFVLLDKWIPSKKSLPRDKALYELAKRYFRSRGPATIDDFMWWSGLSTIEATEALGMIKQLLIHETLDGKTYWFANDMPRAENQKKRVYLLAGFDEYLIGYSDRSAYLDPKFNSKAIFNNGVFHPTIVIDGEIVGIWRPITKGKSVVMRSEAFVKLTKDQQREVEEEFDKYRIFVGGNFIK